MVKVLDYNVYAMSKLLIYSKKVLESRVVETKAENWLFRSLDKQKWVYRAIE